MRLIFFVFIFISSHIAFGQNVVGSSRLVSEIDQSLALRQIAVTPAQDNVDGLYADPLGKYLIELVETDTQLNYAPLETTESYSPESLQESPESALKLLEQASAQGLLSLRIERGPKGTSLVLGLSTRPDGRLLLLEKTEPLAASDTEGLRKELAALYGRFKERLPFDGLIMSRRGNEITVNLGARHGVKVGETLDITQIIDLDRHPRFDFLISTTKTILGTAEVTKVDNALAFALVTKERETGVIGVDAKIERRNLIDYGRPQSGSTPSFDQRKDKYVAFGNNPEEWVPVSAPTFGSVLLFLGIGNYSTNIDISQTGSSTSEAAEAEGSHSSRNQFALSIGVEGEIWINPTWSILAYLDQGAFSISNPYSDGSPDELNVARTSQGILIGYNFLLTENFFGPKLQLLAGLGSVKTQIDNSRPLIFGTTTYSGARLGIRGDMDLPQISELRLGASLIFVPGPDLITSPEIQGGDSSSITHFRVYGTYKLGERFRLFSGLDFQSYSTSFSGSKRRPDGNQVNSHSQRHTQLLVGTQYLF